MGNDKKDTDRGGRRRDEMYASGQSGNCSCGDFD